MPTFDLTQLAVIDAPPIVLDTTTDSVMVPIRLTDPLLWMPAGQTIQVSASFANQAGGRRRLELTGTFAPTVPLLGGHLHLSAINLSIPFSSGANPELAITDTRTVTGGGAARWMLPSLATGLGVAEVEFDVGVSSSAAATGLTLSLSQPLTLPNAFVQIDSADLSVQVLPQEQAFEVALRGEGGLTAEGRAKAVNLLTPVFGGGDPLAAAGVPSTVSLRRRFHLADDSAAIPDIALPAAPALMSIVPDWSGGAAPALRIPTPEDFVLDIGLPEFSLGFDEGAPAASDFGVRLTDCSVRFPALASLPAFDLAGSFELARQGNATTLRLFPEVPGGVDLPGFLSFFLSRLRWIADAANLDELPGQIINSVVDLEWEQLFRGLLTGAGNVPTGFAPALGALIDQAIVAFGGDAERVFLVAFSAFADVADETYGVLWTAASGLGRPDTAAFVARILQLLADSPDVLTAALDAVFTTGGLSLASTLSALVDLGLDTLDDAEEFLRLLMAAMASALDVLNPSDLAVALMDLAVAGDDSATAISVPALLGAPLAFQLPDVTMPAVPALLWSALGGLVSSVGNFVPRLPSSDSLYEVVRNLAGGLGDGLAAIGLGDLVNPAKMLELLDAIIDYSADDLDRELMLLRTSRIPVLGAAVTVAALVRAATTNALPWWDLMGASIDHDADHNTITLDPPGTPFTQGTGRNATEHKRKYLIVSDVHRDKDADDRGFLNFGSIDHFTPNRNLYLRVLDFADDEGYTLIEAGDCEELWYVRNFDAYSGPADELEQILETHTEVYSKLKKLQHEGRHVRIKGNHDSYLDLPSVRSRLDAVMNQPGSSHPFDLYDFAVIPGVKTLQDNALPSVLNPVALLDGTLSIEEFLEDRLGAVLGLDANEYSEKKPMIVAHGHQWDFWNCRGNELIGKMLSNLVGVPVDQVLDPFVDARGIAWGGAPVVNFASVAAELPVFDNFLAPRQAVEFAHRIQHQSSADRLLVDDVMFLETVAALSASLGIEVDQLDGAGNVVTSDDFADPLSRFGGMRFNQLCLGHTHFPQSQPFWDLESLLGSAGVGDMVRQVTQSIIPGWEPSINLVRSRYYNTGTAGWHESVVWAIEITENGHARLVFWTENSIGPETMDWELSEMDPELRQQLDERIAAVSEDVGAVLREMGGHALAAAGAVASVPLELAAAVIGESSSDVELDLGDLLGSDADSPDLADAVIGGLQALIGQLIIGAALVESELSQPRTFTLRVPIPPGVTEALDGVAEILNQVSGIDPLLVPKLACGWIQVVRNLPFFGGFESRRAVAGVDDRVFWVVVSLLFQLPSTATTGSAFALAAQAQFDGDALVVTMTVG